MVVAILSAQCETANVQRSRFVTSPGAAPGQQFPSELYIFLSDEGPMLETLDYTIRIGSIPTFLYFDLYLYIYIYIYISGVRSSGHRVKPNIAANGGPNLRQSQSPYAVFHVYYVQ